MVYVFFAFFLIYFLLILALLAGWQISVLRETKPVLDLEKLSLTVIVPFRNESAVLKTLIQSLQKQIYSSFEVILVDDASTDHSVQAARDLIINDVRFRLLSSDGAGKKRALTTGVNAAEGTIIVTTDADCFFEPDWLTEVNKSFQDDDVKLAFGAVRIDNHAGTLAKLQAIEFTTVLGAGVASFGLKKPVFCNGANLAFRKSLFKELDGYAGNEHIPSGDDTFLFEKVLARYRGGIRFLNTPNAVVTTQPQAGIASFFYQRLRWAGKWRFSGMLSSSVLALFMFFFQLMSTVLYGWLFTGGIPRTLLFLLFTKLLLDYILIFNVSTFLRQKVSLLNFVLVQLVYPFYVVAVGLGSFFMPYSWKDRKLSHRTRSFRSFLS